ncbi:hypothetical protein BDR26DRAFT_1009500 [Obelidium mucronatum]|nr:hypothetical protein BDR26DRAFT_1009500 [Obelidium mucronatum]
MLLLSWPFLFEYRLYSLHPISMALFIGTSLSAAMTLQRMDQADKLSAAKHQNIASHAWRQCIALAFAIIGFAAIYQNKINKGKKHFKSYHGIGGLALFALVLSVSVLGIIMHWFPSRVFGTVAKSKRWLRIKRYSGHAICLLTLVVASLGLISHSTIERIPLVIRLFIFIAMFFAAGLSFWNVGVAMFRSGNNLELSEYDEVHELE